MPRKARYDRLKQNKKIAEIKENPTAAIRREKKEAKTEAGEAKTVKALARVYTQDALEVLAKIMRKSKYPGLQLQAVEQILNRGWGKAVQPLAGGGEGEAPIQIDLQEIRRTIVDPPKYDDDDEPVEQPVKSIEGKKRASMEVIQERVRKINTPRKK